MVEAQPESPTVAPENGAPATGETGGAAAHDVEYATEETKGAVSAIIEIIWKPNINHIDVTVGRIASCPNALRRREPRVHHENACQAFQMGRALWRRHAVERERCWKRQAHERPRGEAH